MGDRRAPDIQQRLLAVYKEQQAQQQRHEEGEDEEEEEEEAGEGGHDEDSVQSSQLPATFLSPSEARLSRLLGCTLLVTLSDRRLYCGRLHCIDRHSLVLADCTQRVSPQQTRGQGPADGQNSQWTAHAHGQPDAWHRLHCSPSTYTAHRVSLARRSAQALGRLLTPRVYRLYCVVSHAVSVLELRVGSVLIGFQHVRRVLLVAAPQLVQQLQAEDEQARRLILPLAEAG